MEQPARGQGGQGGFGKPARLERSGRWKGGRADDRDSTPATGPRFQDKQEDMVADDGVLAQGVVAGVHQPRRGDGLLSQGRQDVGGHGQPPQVEKADEGEGGGVKRRRVRSGGERQPDASPGGDGGEAEVPPGEEAQGSDFDAAASQSKKHDKASSVLYVDLRSTGDWENELRERLRKEVGLELVLHGDPSKGGGAGCMDGRVPAGQAPGSGVGRREAQLAGAVGAADIVRDNGQKRGVEGGFYSFQLRGHCVDEHGATVGVLLPVPVRSGTGGKARSFYGEVFRSPDGGKRSSVWDRLIICSTREVPLPGMCCTHRDDGLSCALCRSMGLDGGVDG